MQWEMFKSVLLEFGVPSNRLESYFYLYEEFEDRYSNANYSSEKYLALIKLFVARKFGAYVNVK